MGQNLNYFIDLFAKANQLTMLLKAKEFQDFRWLSQRAAKKVSDTQNTQSIGHFMSKEQKAEKNLKEENVDNLRKKKKYFRENTL